MLFILLLAFSACSKYKCEEWEVTDEDFRVGQGCGIDLSCAGKRTNQLSFCGDDLKDAKVGNTITLGEDDCCKKTRTFHRLIR